MTKKRVMLVIPNLGGGGAERTMLNICIHLDRRKFEPILVMGEQKGPYCSQIPNDVLVISMGEAHVRRCILKLANIIRSTKPDIILSTLTRMNIVTVVAHTISKSTSKVLIREASVYSKEASHMCKAKRNIFDTLIRAQYRKSDAIIFLSQGAMDDFGKMFPSTDCNKYRVVHNPVDIRSISKLMQEPIEAKWWPSSKRTVVAVGRLSKVKGYNYLLEAMKIVSQSLPQTRLIILGSGTEENNLRAYSRQLGIDTNVQFAGFQENPFKYLANSDVFVLSSLWEGFSHVIVEAMACGVPVIATDCPYGPGEIISNNISGTLVPVGDSQALAMSIIKVIENPQLAHTFVYNGTTRAQDFDVRTIVKKYEMLFEEMVE